VRRARFDVAIRAGKRGPTHNLGVRLGGLNRIAAELCVQFMCRAHSPRGRSYDVGIEVLDGLLATMLLVRQLEHGQRRGLGAFSSSQIRP
jgi:hypothetical protein